MLLKLTFLLVFFVNVLGHLGRTKDEKFRVKREAINVKHIDLKDSNGVISSPGYNLNKDYPTNVDLTWTFHLPEDGHYTIILNITDLQIEPHGDCSWDYFAYGNNFEHKLCGNKPGIYTVQDAMKNFKMRFFSDFYITMRGFELAYSIEKSQDPCSRSPCFNNGMCHRISSSQYTCTCTQHYTGKNCQTFLEKACTDYPCLIFEDNFDYLNQHVWQHELTLGGGGNWEFQFYTNNRSNSYCKDGQLFIKPTLTIDGREENFLETGTIDLWGAGPHDTCTGNAFYGCVRTGTPGNIINPIQSARLRSSRGLNFKYGKVEVWAKLPIGDWIWPAIWMLPTYSYYGTWPASGEIDIMESRGNLNYTSQDGAAQGADAVGTTLHYGPNWRNNGYLKATAAKRLENGTFADDFHKYSVEWTEEHIRLAVDDEETLTVAPDDDGFWKYGGFDELNMENPWRHDSKMAPFDKEFYIILNVAIGGMNFFPDDFTGPRPKPWTGADRSQFWRAKDEWYPTWNPDVRNGEDAALKIDKIRVWKLSA